MNHKEFRKYFNCRYFPHRLEKFKDDELKNLFSLKLEGTPEKKLFLFNGSYDTLEKELVKRVDEHEEVTLVECGFSQGEIDAGEVFIKTFKNSSMANQTWGRPTAYIRSMEQ